MSGPPPSLGDIERLAQEAVEQLPEPFRRFLGNVVLKVEDFPDEEVTREMELETPWDLLGLYTGNPVGDPGGDWTGALPPTIHLYRMPILDEWVHGEDSLAHLVAHVLVHEVGHHFGLSDDDMHAIEDGSP